MRWRIFNTPKADVEEHYSAKSAYRALRILNAHELKNGRKPGYVIHPPVDPIPIEELGLPDWALEALK